MHKPLLSIDFFSVADAHNKNANLLILDVADYPVIANSILPKFA
jgi:hypothetical protein